MRFSSSKAEGADEFFKIYNHQGGEEPRETNRNLPDWNVNDDETSVLSNDPTAVPSMEGIYLLDASPTDQLCVTVMMSWVAGESTFIRDELG